MKVVSEHTWCLTDKGERVPEGHPLARFLLVNKGSEIEDSHLESFPLLEEKPEAEPQKIEVTIDEPEPPARKRPKAKPPPAPPVEQPKVRRPRVPKGPPPVKEIKTTKRK